MDRAIHVSPYKPQERYILFVLTVEFAFMNVYVDGKSHFQNWQALSGQEEHILCQSQKGN